MSISDDVTLSFSGQQYGDDKYCVSSFQKFSHLPPSSHLADWPYLLGYDNLGCAAYIFFFSFPWMFVVIRYQVGQVGICRRSLLLRFVCIAWITGSRYRALNFWLPLPGKNSLQSRYRAPFKILHLTWTGRYLALSFWLVVTWQSKSLPGSIFFTSIGRYLASFSFYACRYLTKLLGSITWLYFCP